MNHLIYLAHGGQGYRDECRFSLLKLLHVYNLVVPQHTAVVICTDRPNEFEPFRPFLPALHLELVNEALLREWIAGTGYVHRAKTKMIQHVLEKYGGNVLFMDTDTYLTKPIDDLWPAITKGTVYLHVKEGVLDRHQGRSFRKWDRFLESANLYYSNQPFVYDKHLAIWNSGVLGLSAQHAPVLNEVVELIDAIYARFPKHITEQVAVSYCLGRAFPISAAEDQVAHYWNLKEFRVFLHQFFGRHAEEGIPSLVKKAAPVDALKMQAEKQAYNRLPFWQRWLKKSKGKAWRIDQYRTAI